MRGNLDSVIGRAWKDHGSYLESTLYYIPTPFPPILFLPQCFQILFLYKDISILYNTTILMEILGAGFFTLNDTPVQGWPT